MHNYNPLHSKGKFSLAKSTNLLDMFISYLQFVTLTPTGANNPSGRQWFLTVVPV